jgi:hypothetical protein
MLAQRRRRPGEAVVVREPGALVPGNCSEGTRGARAPSLAFVVDTDLGGDNSHDDAPPPQSRPKRTWWWQRPTVHQLQRDAKRHRHHRDKSDARWNNETRLPEGEAVHLGGVTLAEAFTPSTVSNLYSTLNKWPRPFGRPDDDWASALERSRSGTGEGWTSLGLVRRPGQFVMGDGHHDGTLPLGVQGAWLSLSYLLATSCLQWPSSAQHSPSRMP